VCCDMACCAVLCCAALQMHDVLGPLPRHMLANSALALRLQLDLDKLGEGPRVAAPAPLAGGQQARPVFQALARLDPQLGDLLGKLLCFDPASRITAAEVRGRWAGLGTRLCR
jgi:hypothetical protein